MDAGNGGPKREEFDLESPRRPGAKGEASPQKPDCSRALAEIFTNHHSALVRFLSVRTGSVEDAKEIVQEAYARVLALDRPGTISLLAGYLWRTAVNLATDRRRERVLRERFSRTAAFFTENQEFSAESTCDARERLAIVERAIGELPSRCQDAFVLHVLNDLKLGEVARQMAISERMVRKYVARALEYLQTCLDAADVTRGRR